MNIHIHFLVWGSEHIQHLKMQKTKNAKKEKGGKEKASTQQATVPHTNSRQKTVAH